MPAIYEDPDGTIRYYIPPPPPPPPPPPKPKIGTDAPGFQHAVTVAKQATSSYFSGHSSETEKTKVLNDWASVGAIIADQYRVAWTSANPKAAVAALDRQYGKYFQNNGRETTIYNSVVSSAKGQVQGETTGQRQAEAKYYQDENEPASPTKTADLETDAIAITKADITAELQSKFGKGNNGVYTADQIQAAANALDNLDTSASPLVDYVATDMEDGRTLSDVLTVLQTKGLKLTPAEIKSGSLGTIKLTPAETKSGTLILTPAEAQIAAKDPVTIAFLKADGITVTQLSPQMAQLAQQNPVLFSLMEINKVNISIPTGGNAVPASDLYSVPTGGNVGPTLPHTVYKLSDGSVLDITIDGKPYDPPTGTSSAQIISIYEGAEAAKKGTGVVALANMLLPQLSVNGTTLSNPSTTQLANLASLMTDADGARSQYASGKLASLLAVAPAAGSKDAAGYVAGTINPFLTTQLNGFFTPQGRSTFWNTSPAISPLQTYLKTGIAAQFQPGNVASLNMAGVYLSKVLAGASPEEAKMLIGLVEGQVNSVSPSKQGSYTTPDTALLNALGQAAQIVDDLPLGGTQPKPGAEADQIAKWLLNTTERGVPVLGQWVADDFYYNITTTGDTDLPEALIDAWSTSGKYVYGTNGATPIELGNVINWTNDAEGTYDSTIEKQLGAEGFKAFENNKAQTLNTFYTEYAKVPGINVKISKSDTNDLQTAIIKAYGFTSSSMTPAQKNIVKIDMSWIANQSDPGATVTILPFIFASSTMGMQTGVFFDISNPGNTNNPQQKSHPTQVLIDGSAAQYALQADGDAAQHPESVDVKWHYSSYRDFQLNNELYQNGTIYTLPNNPLGIKSDGSASSATDFHKEFDSVMDDVAGGAAIVGGIALLPFTDGASAVLTGVGLGLTGVSLGWGTYQAISQYGDYTSHGEQFTLSNPNTRWAIVGDTMLAANYATLGFGAAAGGFTRAAERIGQTADTLTYVSDTRNAMSAVEETGVEDLPTTAADVSPEDVIPEMDGVPSAATGGEAGNPVPASLSDVLSQLKAMETVNSQFATGFNWLKKGSEVAGYGLGGVQTVVSTYSTVTNWDNMSWGQRGMGVLNIGEGVLPFFMEPIANGMKEFADNRNSESSKEKPSAWKPSSADQTLIIGRKAVSGEQTDGESNEIAVGQTPPADVSDDVGGPIAKQASEGEVYLGTDPAEEPDIVGDIGGKTLIPDDHFSTVVFRDYVFSSLMEGSSLGEAYRVLKSGGTLRIEATAGAARDSDAVISKLEDAGFENVVLAEIEGLDEATDTPYEFKASKPSVAGELERALTPVNELARQQFGVDLLPEGKGVPVHVLSDDEFDELYDIVGGAGDPADVLAFTRSDSDGNPTFIAVREDAADVPTLTHELIHSSTSPEFKKAAQQFVLNPDQSYSNLGEEVVNFLVSQLMSGADSPQTAVVSEIFQEMEKGEFYRAVFDGDPDAIDTFSGIAADKFGAPGESRPLELVEAKTTPPTMPSDMPSRPVLTAGQLKDILNAAFENRSSRLSSKIQNAGGSDSVFLDPSSKDEVKAVLLNAWKGALLDPASGAKAHTTNDTDAEFVQQLVGYIQQNKLEMQVPAGSSLTLHFMPDEIDQLRVSWNNTPSGTMANIDQFLDHLLSGAHFVIPRLDKSAPDFFSAFTGGELNKSTKRVLANTHYVKEGGVLSHLPASEHWRFSRGGLRYPNDIKSDETPNNPAILSALLVGHTRQTARSDEGDTYFQVEGWPPVARGGFLGRHFADTKTHQDNGDWNISTYGASSFGEKREQGKYGNAIQLKPSDETRLGLMLAKQTDDFTSQLLDDQSKISAFVGKIKTAVKGEADKAVDDALELAQTGNAHKATSKALHRLAQSNRFGKGVVRKEGAAIVADVVGGRTDVTGEIIRSVTRADLKTQRQKYWPLSSGSRWQRHGAQELAESATSAARVKVAADVKTKADAELDALAGDDQRGGQAGWTGSDYVKSLLDVDGASAEILPGLLKTKVGEALEAVLGQTGTTVAQQLSRLESDPDGLLADVLRTLNAQSAGLDPAEDTVLHESGGNVAAVAAYKASGEVWKTTRAEARRTAKPELTKVITDTLQQRATAKAGEISASLKDWIADQAASQQNLRTLRERLTGQDRLGNVRAEALAEAKSRWEQRLNTDANEISDAVLNGVLDTYVRDAENSPSGANPASTISREGFAASVSKVAQDILTTRPASEEKQVLAAAQIVVESLKHVLDGDKSGSEKLVDLWNAAQSAFTSSDPALASARGAARDAVVAAVREDVESRTANTTKAAADWIARDPDFKQGTLGAAQETISAQFKDSYEFTSSLGNKRAAEGIAKTEARRQAGRNEPAPVVAARTKADEMFDAGLPEAVLEQNFKPNPEDYTLSKWERGITRLMESRMRNVTYTAQAYEEIRGLLPQELAKKLPEKLSDFEPDRMTRMLAEVPAGLEQIIADIHSHPMGYDRREGNLVLGLIDKAGDFSRVLSGSIPQWCGGDSHYSTATPSKATMKRAYELDQRAVKDWLEIYNGNGKNIAKDPEKAAQVDLSLTGVNFADSVKLAKFFPNPEAMHEAFSNPTAYITKMMKEHPGMFPAVGEITGIKEMVTKQLGGWRWNVGSQKFRNFLSLANDTGQVVLLHNDWGEHAESAAGRPSAAKQHYEHLSLLKYVFSRPEYRNVQIVFAHTGIGRLVRPDDEMSVSTREYTIAKFDPKTGQVDASSPAVKKSITAPEHIHQLYQLFEAVPNARVDISWNDVTQAYTHLMQKDSASSADAAKAVVDFFIDHQDRILFGSDTVKPVNPGHYNQALMTGSPLFVDITRRDPDAAFKILRGNYDDAMKAAYQRSDAWTKTQLLDGANKPSSEVSAKIQKMENLRQELDGIRDQLGTKARTQFDEWVAKVGGDWSSEANNAKPGVYQTLAEQLPHSTPLDRSKGALNGPGTSGGTKNGVLWRRYGTGATSLASMAGAGVAAHFGMPALDHASFLSPTTGGGFAKPMPGSDIANALTSGGFLVRGIMNFGRTAYLEQLRLQWEQIFEQGAVTRDGLNRYVSRLFNAAPYLGITALQRAHISAATEQFWTDYTYLRDQPLSSNYTEQQRFLALHAKIGEYMITVSREGNLQESSLSAADSRRFEGRWFRSGLLATYGINEAVALNWMESSGLHQVLSMQFLHQGSILADAQSASELLYRSLFLLGNAMLMTREGNSLIGGLFGISGMETNRLQKALQRWGQLALGVGGVGWTINGGLSTAADVRGHNGTAAALDLATTFARGAFTWAALRGYGDEFNRAHALPMSGPLKLSKPQLVLAGALGAAMIISLTQTGLAASMPKPAATPTPTPTPTKSPSVTPSKTALVTPSATPSVAPTRPPFLAPSTTPLPRKTAQGGRHH
jgi:hypothetical protein